MYWKQVWRRCIGIYSFSLNHYFESTLLKPTTFTLGETLGEVIKENGGKIDLHN